MKVREFKQILFRNVPRLQQALLELRGKNKQKGIILRINTTILDEEVKEKTNAVAKHANSRSCLPLAQGSRLFHYLVVDVQEGLRFAATYWLHCAAPFPPRAAGWGDRPPLLLRLAPRSACVARSFLLPPAASAHEKGARHAEIAFLHCDKVETDRRTEESRDHHCFSVPCSGTSSLINDQTEETHAPKGATARAHDKRFDRKQNPTEKAREENAARRTAHHHHHKRQQRRPTFVRRVSTARRFATTCIGARRFARSARQPTTGAGGSPRCRCN
jgi:hypothetical protein